MTAWTLFTSTWDWEPSVVAGSVLLLAAYLAAVGFRFSRTAVLFASGVATMFLALVSPLDELGDDYLFSAHMLQHILLDFVAPMLFVLGLPAALVKRILSWRPAALAERLLGAPPLAWALGVGTLWVWHLPALYDATLSSEAVHTFEHLTFLVTGTIFFWPVFARTAAPRLAPMPGIAYLGLAALANSVLGVIFTLASTPFYPAYLHPADTYGALAFLRHTWGLTPVADQELGGVFMWAIGSVIFLAAIMIVFVRWFEQPEAEPAARGLEEKAAR